MSKVLGRGGREQSGAETFLRAMEQAKVRLARFVLEALDGNIVNMRLESGRTLLMEAVLLSDVRQRLRFVKLLLGRKSDVNCRDHQGRTALSHSCECGNIEVVQLLVQYNADPEIVDIWGNSALMYGAMAGQTLVVEFLVRSFKRLGLDINRTNAVGNSAIDVAQYLGHHDCVHILASRARKWSHGEVSNGGPLKDITFKRCPYGQNQGSSVTSYRERGRRAQVVHGYKIPQGTCQPHKHLQEDDGPSNCFCDDSHNVSLNINHFPKALELFSGIDQEYGDAHGLFQPTDPPVRQERENSSCQLREKGQGFILPCVGSENKISADCSRLLERQRLKVPRVNGANLQGSFESASILCKGCREVQVKDVSGGCSKIPRHIRPQDKDAENQPIHSEQDLNMCVKGRQALSQHWDKAQDKTIGCPVGPLSSCSGNSITLPTVGKRGELGFFAPQIRKKEIHKVMSSSSSCTEDMLDLSTVGKGMRSSHVHINSMGNIEGQGITSEKPSALESERKMDLRCVQTGILSETVMSLPLVAPPRSVTQMTAASTNVVFPRDINSVLSEICSPDDEVLEKALKLSDCELEGLQVFDDICYKKRFSLPDGSCVPRRKPKSLRGPPTLQCQPEAETTGAFSMLRLFRRFTIPQLKTRTEHREGFTGQSVATLDGGRRLCCSETFPNHGELSGLAGKPVSAALRDAEERKTSFGTSS